MNFGIALLRLVVGGLFAGHGLQKLKGWFGGYGLEATGQAFDGMGLRPGKHHATAAAVSETAGGVLLATGFLTPVAATAITGTMAVAVEKVHKANGPWVTEGGYEYNLVLTTAALAIAATGPGAISLDRLLGTERKGTFVALLAAAAGLAGAVGTLKYAESQPVPAGEPAADAA